MMRQLLSSISSAGVAEAGGDKAPRPGLPGPPAPGEYRSEVLLYVNGERHLVSNPDPSMLLVTYLRDVLRLTGTKIGCGEGGCGACTVVLGRMNAGKPEYLPVNACLRPLCACDGMAVLTVEGMGSANKPGGKLHPIQERIAKGNGTQCGFCTPGWVANCQGLLLQHEGDGGQLSDQEIERHFDGNLCRCTGYRPILEAFKSFATEKAGGDGGGGDKKKKGHGHLTRRRLDSSSSTSTSGSSEDEEADWVHVHNHARRNGAEATTTPCPHRPGHICVGDVEDLCHDAPGSCPGRRQQQQHHQEEGTQGQGGSMSYRGAHPALRPGRARKAVIRSQGQPPEAAEEEEEGQRRHLQAATADALPFPDELKTYQPAPLRIVQPAGKTWYRVLTLADLLAVLRQEEQATTAAGQPKRRVQLVYGNTGIVGVSKYYNDTFPSNTPEVYDVLCDVSQVKELRGVEYDDKASSLKVGAATSINQLIAHLRQHGDGGGGGSGGGGADAAFPHGQSVFGMLASHLGHIAHEQVRNAGSWAGNLMMFKLFPAFPSDANLVFTAADARLTIAYVGSGVTSDYTMEQFWQLDPDFEPFIVVAATLRKNPFSGSAGATGTVVARSFRVAQRAVNSHPHTNAAFVALLSSDSNASSCQDIRIVYSGVSKTAFRASAAEAALKGQRMDEAALGSALAALDSDLVTVGVSAAFGAEGFRVALMRNLLYKFFLVSLGSGIPPNLASAVAITARPVSQASQTYTPDDALAPVSQPVPKLGGFIQATGEAVYTDDEPLPQNALHGAYVYSTRALAKVRAIDAAAALRVQGVAAVVTAKDIPGKNDVTMGAGDEQLLVPEGGLVQCVGQPVAVVLADTAEVARAAARLVAVAYDAVDAKPVLSFADGIARQSFLPPGSVKELACGDADKALGQAKHRKTGRLEMGGQKHFYFEPQTTLAVPTEQGVLNLYTSTQAPSDTHTVVARVVGRPKHKVTVQARRAGGGFGGKLTRCFQNAATAAVCASKLGRPVRVSNDRITDFVMVGGREPMIFDYDVGFDERGKVTALKYKVYMEGGAAADNTPGDNDMAMEWIDNVYHFPNFKASQFCVKTNLPVTTSMRAPGVVQAVMATEMVLAEVARELGLPQQAVQEANFYKNGDCTPYGQVIEDTRPLRQVWDSAKALADVEKRRQEVEEYNAAHRWRKRGLCLTPVKYGMGWAGIKAAASVHVFQEDASVVINHHGCEVGQGIHTKVAQAAAYRLGVPMENITVSPTSTNKIPNGSATGGSGTSESAVQAMLNACDELTKRLQPVKDKLSDGGKKKNVAWKDVVAAAAADGINLAAEGWFAPQPSGSDPFQYYIWCAALCVLEMDVLTGEVVVPLCEIVYDCGQALNPLVDIGQIEGAFIQGLGYYLTEDVRFDQEGRLLTSGTWEYKPPSAMDIPLEFNVTLIPKDLNPGGVLQSKATGEPPYMLASALYFAAKDAIRAAHKDMAAATASKAADAVAAAAGGGVSDAPAHRRQLHAPDSSCADKRKKDSKEKGRQGCETQVAPPAPSGGAGVGGSAGAAGGGGGGAGGAPAAAGAGGEGEGGGSQAQQGSQQQDEPPVPVGGGEPAEDVSLPIPATIDWRVLALNVTPAAMVLK